jgi:hypothetical protein
MKTYGFSAIESRLHTYPNNGRGGARMRITRRARKRERQAAVRFIRIEA